MGIVQFIVNKLVGYDITSKQKEWEQSISSLQKEKEDLTCSVRQLNERLTTVEREKTNSDNLINELKQSVNEYKEKNSFLIDELNVSKTYGEEQKQRATQVINQLNAYKTNYKKAKKAKDELNNKLTQDKSRYEEIIANDKQALQEANEAKESIQALLIEKQELLERKESEIEQINATLTQLQDDSRNNKQSADEIRELEDQIQVFQEQLSDGRREIEIKNSQLTQKEHEIKEIGNALTDAHEQVKELQDKIDAANTEITDKEYEIQRLKEIINKQDNSDEIDQIAASGKDGNSEQGEATESNVSEEPTLPASTDDGFNKQEKPDVESSSATTESGNNPQEQSCEPEKKQRVVARTKSKEEEAIEMSGNSMMDFPPIINDSNKHVQRSIEYVYDKESHKIYAKDFFDGTAEEIARKSRQLEEAGLTGKNDFVCGMCHRQVKIAHRTINGRESLFFAHATRNEYCAWIPYSTSSKDDDILVDELDIELTEQEFTTKPHSRVLKEMIFSLLCTPESEELGISDVKCDAVIRSTVPYMKWRRPDISFRYREKDVVIVMQRKKHDLRMLVDRDVFFRLNNHHVIWVFGADNDVSYDYMRMSNYKNTMFDCHRNVFVFDKEAQQKSEERNTLCLKYNWLDENDNWAVNHANIGSNGLIADISDFIFDDEYCKPYIREANEPYFELHPDAKEQFLETRKSREQLLKEFEEKWKGEPSYEEALRMMKLRGDKATPFQYMGLWGFRFNTTTLIQPVFTEQPVDLHNGFYMVKQGKTAGIVNYLGEVIMDWTNLECDKLTVDVVNNRVLFLKGSWGIADYNGDILIQPQFIDINPWSDTIYRVRKFNLWGLQSIEDTTVAPCDYESIGDLVSGKAEAILRDKNKAWVKYKGLLDSNGHVIDTNTKVLNEKYIAYERFSRWGIRSTLGQIIIEPTYEEVVLWTSEAIRVKTNGKWGVIGLPDGNVILPAKYDSIDNITDGKARITYVGVANLVDANGNILSEESIKLQDGFVKSKIGGKWGIEKDGKEIVPHKYDEIGSFRQRLIGVINSSIVKLNAYYDYPVPISGRCSGIGTGGTTIDIAGVTCYMPSTFGFEGKFYNGYICNDIAFGNLLFSQKRYLLRFVSEAQMQKKTSHGDKDSDFSMNEIVTGTVTKIMRYRTPAGKIKTTKVKVKMKDGRETMVPRRFFIAVSLKIEDFKIGDTIQIQKTGFDDELDQTTWLIKETKHIS